MWFRQMPQSSLISSFGTALSLFREAYLSMPLTILRLWMYFLMYS